MKKLVGFMFAIIMLFSACGQNSPVESVSGSGENGESLSWQEQYDLGVRYLSEGNYQEAIIAFTAAIEIDPKQAVVYVGRAQAYVLSGESDENLTAAQADYETALDLDDTNAEAWLGLADVYIRRGEYEKALEILREGLDKTKDDQSILDKIMEIEQGEYTDSSGQIRRQNFYTPEGKLTGYAEFYYDELGRRNRWDNYNFILGEGTAPQFTGWGEITYDPQTGHQSHWYYAADGTLSFYRTFVYDGDLMTEYHDYNADGSENGYVLFYYDDRGRQEKREMYDSNGQMYAYSIIERDENGNSVGETVYNADGTISGYTRNE